MRLPSSETHSLMPSISTKDTTSLQSFPKMHLIIVKDIEIYFLEPDMPAWWA